MSRADAFVPLAMTVRSGFPESFHFGAMVGLERDGAVAFVAGDPTVAIYPRSATKPMQALVMVQLGLQLPPELLALVCASHDGTPMHLELARRILATVGVDETSLSNTPGLPLDDTSSADIIRAGGGPTALQQNCSGKHAGMLATCVINGWSIEDYFDPTHPLQLAITDGFPALIGESVAHVGVDGCGTPAHVMSLVGLARAFRNIAVGAAGDAAAAVYEAMIRHPQIVGGEYRDVTTFIRHVPGLLAKDGADGVFAAALPDGRSVAVKIADGANRARPAVMVQALRALGVDMSSVEPLVRQPIMGHGLEVGELAAIAELSDVAGDETVFHHDERQ